MNLGRGLALRGTVWPGGDEPAYDGVVALAPDGTIAAMGPVDQFWLPGDVPVLGGPGYWVGPGVVDAHVHLAFAVAERVLRRGVVGVRDLGAPLELAMSWRTGRGTARPGLPYIAVAGPVITAPGGYPSHGGGGEFAAAVSAPGPARQLVGRLARSGVDLIKVALEPGPGWPVPAPDIVRTVVQAAHEQGLAVVAHAVTVETVARALDAGVDELAHTPIEPLPDPLIERIAASGITVTSTLQAFFSDGRGREAARNAARLVSAGVSLVYGTDLGNLDNLRTRSGVDPRELDRLADAGLGRRGALRAATEGSARVAGIRGRTGRLTQGAPASVVLLAGDPLVEPQLWWRPVAVACDGQVYADAGAGVDPPRSARLAR